MAIDNFIPEIWAAGVQEAFFANQIVIPTLNTQFSGDARKGNTVHIINATTPTIVDYAGAGRTISAEALADTEVQLLIDQERAFSVNVDDVDAVQAAGSFDAWVSAAGMALAEDAEEYAVAQLLAGATDGNAGAVVVDTFDEAKGALRKIRTEMAKAKVPTGDRFVAVNPAFADLLIGGLSDAAVAGGSNELRNGQVARLYGMDILETAAFAEGTDPVAVGYHASAAAFVSQIDKVESLRNPTKFADIVRGLNVYGSKVTRPAGVIKFVSA
jgi:hypothetical protein